MFAAAGFAAVTVLLFIYGAAQRNLLKSSLKKIELETIKSENRVHDAKEIYEQLESKIRTLREERYKESDKKRLLLAEIRDLEKKIAEFQASIKTETFETAVASVVESKLIEQRVIVTRFHCGVNTNFATAIDSAIGACCDFWGENPGKTLYVYKNNMLFWSGASKKSLAALRANYKDHHFTKDLYVEVVTNSK